MALSNLSDPEAGPRFLFDRLPVSMWEEDLSGIKARIEALRREGVSNFAEYFRAHPQEAAEIVRCARVIDVNPATLELFGATGKAELLANLDRLLPADASLFFRLTPNMICLALGESRCSGEFQAQTLQGKPLYLAFAWNVADGDVTTYAHVFYTLFDITRRKQAEEDRARMAEELRQAQKMEAIGVLASGLAHDFNNVLTVIRGGADLLESHVQADAEAADTVHEIRRASQRAAELIRQLLSYARRGDRQTVRVDVHTIIRNTCGLLSHSLGRDIRMTMDLAAADPFILTDPTQVDTALLNLALNARDAMPQGGTIHVATRRVEAGEPGGGAQLEISVSDTGVGIAPEILPRLFEPFFTTKPKGEGTGLGLASVQGFVKSHGGSLQVKSELGKGASFTMRLPCAEAVAVGAVADGGRATRPVPPKAHILIVDDESTIRSIAAKVVRGLGFEVTTCEDGEAALSVLDQRAGAVELVILDMVMPTLAGEDVFRAIQARWPGLPVLLISGYSRTETVDALLREGAIGFLGKPFGLADLAREVTGCVAARRTRSAGQPAPGAG